MEVAEVGPIPLRCHKELLQFSRHVVTVTKRLSCIARAGTERALFIRPFRGSGCEQQCCGDERWQIQPFHGMASSTKTQSFCSPWDGATNSWVSLLGYWPMALHVPS